MRRALSIAGVLMLAVSGCSDHRAGQGASTTSVSATPVAVSAAPQALPQPQALADVMSRLADPAVPGPDKLGLVAGATKADAVSLDSFAAALRDGGYTPVTVTAAELGWSATVPGDVSAMVTITGTKDGPADEFRFPLEFRAHDGGWQLTRETADMLLVFGP